jgi:hypothetical protein
MIRLLRREAESCCILVDFLEGLLYIKYYLAQRSSNRAGLYSRGIFCGALNMKDTVQAVAEAVIGIEYYLVLYKV